MSWNDEIINATEAMQILGVSRKKFYELLNAGRVPFHSCPDWYVGKNRSDKVYYRKEIEEMSAIRNGELCGDANTIDAIMIGDKGSITPVGDNGNTQPSAIPQVFNFGKHSLRVEIINKIPYFNAKDLCKSLGYVKPRNAVAHHVFPEDALKLGILSNDGKQQMSYVNESGMYALIFGSKLASAREFKHWVTSEVLPSIRKTGQYIVGQGSKIMRQADFFTFILKGVVVRMELIGRELWISRDDMQAAYGKPFGDIQLDRYCTRVEQGVSLVNEIGLFQLLFTAKYDTSFGMIIKWFTDYVYPNIRNMNNAYTEEFFSKQQFREKPNINSAEELTPFEPCFISNCSYHKGQITIKNYKI